MRPPQRRALVSLGGNRSGSSAVEFAIVVPVLLVLMLAGIQLVTYINALRKIEHIAASVGEMISSTANQQGSSTATATPADIHFAYDSTLVLFPYVMTDAQIQGISWWQDVEIDISSVKFQQISTNCAGQTDLSSCYLAQVAWTTATGSHNRPCATPLLPAADTAPANSATLPSSVYGPGSVIVVDVYFTFHPSFGSAFIAPVKIEKSVYMKPRYADFIAMNFTGDGIVTQCPGF